MKRKTPIPVQLNADPSNPNRMNNEDKQRMAKSLKEFGDLSGVVINRKTGLMVGGHQRADVLKEAEMHVEDLPHKEPDGTVARGYMIHDGQKYAVRVVDWPEIKAHAAMLAANRFSRVGKDDPEILRRVIGELQAADLNIDLTGYDANALADLMPPEQDLPPDQVAQIVDRAAELQKKWGVKPGQLWDMGPHRILCGSCTDQTSWDRLMKGEKAVLCNTDPPYGVSYGSADGKMIKGDNKREDDLLSSLLLPALKLAVKNTAPYAAFYIWHASATRRDFEEALDAAGLLERQYITWVKDTFVMGHAHYHWQTEPAFYCGKAGQASRWLGDRKQRTVWRIQPPTPAHMAASIANGLRLSDGAGNQIYISPDAPKNRKTRLIRLEKADTFYVVGEHETDAWEIARDPAKGRFHPTQKPVALFDIPIQNHTVPGDLVVDPFAGGGGQFVAANRANRKCYGMDLDPKYVAVILERMMQEGVIGENKERKNG